MRSIVKGFSYLSVFFGYIYCSSVLAQDDSKNKSKRNFEKIVVVFLENQGYEAAARQPFFKDLLSKGALLSNFYAQTHPSQPN